MANHDFIGSAAGSSTASAIWKVGGGLSFVSAQGNWKLVISANEYSLERFYSGGFTEIAGGALSLADARALWLGLMDCKGNADHVFDGAQWKTLHVGASSFDLQRYYSAAFHTIAGSHISGAALDELRDLLDLYVS